MPKDFNNMHHPHNNRGGKKQVLPIYSVTPFTMLDFPDKTACIIWFSGCNMRCSYCHNPQIVKGKGTKNIKDVLSFLEKRQGLLDGVVLSGGEVSVYPDLPDFIQTIKNMGFAVKIDTNGLRPDLIKKFLSQSLVDYVALDYKAPPNKFKTVTGIDKFNAFEETLNLLCSQNTVPFEIRTTVHTSLMNETDVSAIIHDLENKRYTGSYYIQNYINNGGPTLGCLNDQEHVLNIKSIPSSQNFSIEFRNF